jgi:hypothetical protein
MLDKYFHEIIERVGKNSRVASAAERTECIHTSNMLISKPARNERKGPEIIILNDGGSNGKGNAGSVLLVVPTKSEI